MTDEAVEPLYDQMDEARDRIADTPAHTLAGVFEQVLLALRCHYRGNQLGPAEIRALENAAGSLKRLLAEERCGGKRQQRQRLFVPQEAQPTSSDGGRK